MTTATEPDQDQQALVAALLKPNCYPHPVERVEHLETHISHLLLAGDYVYKIKKPLDLGFLDFTTLAKRRAACREELRLNRRTAPDLYLDLVAITGHCRQPQLGGDPAAAIEYAVRMVRFPQQALGERLLAAGQLRRRDMEALGRELAVFHGHISTAGPTS
ncbi:MAG: hypothetical protein R3310_17725, partial [Candidatus Competibacteraceae bacterium]|nr:hypothetical protein [Candidatus Competibacteraceae bacterium]